MRRRLLSALLGSIAVNAALGIYALVVPHFGDLQRHVLLTSVCVTAAGVVTLACLPAWERHRLWPVPPAAVGVCGAGLVLAVVLEWTEAGGRSEALARTMGTLFLLGGAGVLASLLALARLELRFRRVLPLTLGLLGLLVLVWIAALWSEWESPPAWALRAYGVLAVLVAAFVVTVPVLHRASARVATESRPVRFCPACGKDLSARAGEEATCPACGAGFRVRYVERPAAHPASRRPPREEPDPLARARPTRGT